MKEHIPTEWQLNFSREGSWHGFAEKKTSTHKVHISAWDVKYPTFDDCYNALLGKIKLYEQEKIK